MLDLLRHINLFIDCSIDGITVIEKSLFKDAFKWSYHQIKIHELNTQSLGFQNSNAAGGLNVI